MADYGYFGKGAEGYAHYTQTFKSTFPNSSGSGSCGNSRSTVHSSPSTQVNTAERKDAEPQIPYDRKEYADPDLENATLNVMFGMAMLVIAAAVLIGIVVSL